MAGTTVGCSCSAGPARAGPVEDVLLPLPGDSDNGFGSDLALSVAIDGDLLVAGGVHFDEEVVFVYRYDGEDDWNLEAILPSPTPDLTGFGLAVDVTGNLVAVGARFDDEEASSAGAVHFFRYDGEHWGAAGRGLAATAGADDRLGTAVSAQGELVLAGAPGADGQSETTGTAVVFDLLGADCNMNGRPDECDIADGTSEDANDNGIPDECECEGDVNGNGDVGFSDLLAILTAWGPCPPGDCPEDLDGNGEVGFGDALIVLLNWGPCR